MPTAPPCVLVIFGASGDLAKRKLIPAIYEMAREKLLPDEFVRRRLLPLGDDRRAVPQGVPRGDREVRPHQAGRRGGLEAARAALLLHRRRDYGSAEDHARARRQRSSELDKKHGTGGNRLFYLSTPPETFEPIIERLGEHEAGRAAARTQDAAGSGSSSRSRSAATWRPRKELNELLHKYFAEDQVFRIDHYLGKETVQNLMVMRFANSIFEPIWNYKYIDHVQITVSETLGVGTRGGYYDKSGATARHGPEPHVPAHGAGRDGAAGGAGRGQHPRREGEGVQVDPPDPRRSRSTTFTVRGQYGAGERERAEDATGYRKEKGVPPDSKTETFAALKLFIDNWRWSGTPFYLRTGKFLPEKLSEVVVRFRSPPLTLFQKQCESPVYPNDLIIRVQPEEGISWRLNGKVPGGADEHQAGRARLPLQDDVQRRAARGLRAADLRRDDGDQTLFIRGDEAEAAWAVIDPIEQGWAQAQDAARRSTRPGTGARRRRWT